MAKQFVYRVGIQAEIIFNITSGKKLGKKVLQAKAQAELNTVMDDSFGFNVDALDDGRVYPAFETEGFVTHNVEVD